MLNQYDLNFDSLISNFPGYLLIKDLESTYLSANANLVSEFGLKKSDDVYGYTDNSIPHPWAELADFSLDLDRRLLASKNQIQGVYAFPFHGEVRPFKFNRTILKNREGKNTAMMACAVECKTKQIYLIINQLIEMDKIYKIQEKNDDNCYLFDAQYDNISLTWQESSCLFYLLRNKSRSDLSHLLNISVSEVDIVIDRIFQQVMVRSKAELIDVAIQRNYFRIIPPGIVTNLSFVQENAFTKRELDCAKYLLKGMRHKEIAEKLNISNRTVETHLNNLKTKLNCRDKIALAIKLKEIVTVED